MPGVAGRQPFSLEDVSEMGAASRALDLDTLPVRVRETSDRSRYLLVERRPTAVRVELVFRAEEWRTASLAFVGSGLEVPVVLSGERHLGALVDDDPGFGPGERTERNVSGVVHGPGKRGSAIT